MERAPLGFCLMLRTPPGTPATHVRPRPGHEHGPGTTPSVFVEPPINAFTHMRATSRRRPVRSSPRPWVPDGTGTPSAFPRASHPAITRGARRGGDRSPSTDLNHALRHRPSLQSSVDHSIRATSRRTRPCGTLDQVPASEESREPRRGASRSCFRHSTGTAPRWAHSLPCADVRARRVGPSLSGPLQSRESGTPGRRRQIGAALSLAERHR